MTSSFNYSDENLVDEQLYNLLESQDIAGIENFIEAAPQNELAHIEDEITSYKSGNSAFDQQLQDLLHQLPGAPPRLPSPNAKVENVDILYKSFTKEVDLRLNDGKGFDLNELIALFTQLCNKIMGGGQANTEADIESNKAQAEAVAKNNDEMNTLTLDVQQKQADHMNAQLNIQQQEADAQKSKSLSDKIGDFFKNTAIAFAGFVVNAAIAFATSGPAGIAIAAAQFCASVAILAVTTFVDFDAEAAKKFPYHEGDSLEDKAKTDALRNEFKAGIKSALVATMVAVSVTCACFTAGVSTATTAVTTAVIVGTIAASLASTMMQTGMANDLISLDVANKQQTWIAEAKANNPKITDEELQKIVSEKSGEYQKNAAIASMVVLMVGSVLGSIVGGAATSSGAASKLAKTAQEAEEAAELATKAVKDGTKIAEEAAEAVETAKAAKSTVIDTIKEKTLQYKTIATVTDDVAQGTVNVAQGATTLKTTIADNETQGKIIDAKEKQLEKEKEMEALKIMLDFIKQIIDSMQSNLGQSVQEGVKESNKMNKDVTDLVSDLMQTMKQGTIATPPAA